MATIYVSEYTSMANALNGAAQVAQHPGVQQQSMAITASSTTLPTAFTPQTRFIRVQNDSICSIAIGSGTPVAVTTKFRVPAETIEYHGVNPGDTLAVIANT
jgi:LysM repeat protein